jgi:hypothetical protein
MREDRATSAHILQRLAEIDRSLLSHDAALRDIDRKLREGETPAAMGDTCAPGWSCGPVIGGGKSAWERVDRRASCEVRNR